MSDNEKIPYPRSLQEIVGALLFASETPLSAGDLKNIVRSMDQDQDDEVAGIYRSCTAREIEEALRGLEKALEVAGCGFSLVLTGGTYRLQTVPPCGRYVRSMLKMDRPGRLGRASLETLAIIAYRQPVTKSEVEEIRGVDVSGNVKTLMDLGLIRLVGKSELPGHPFLYGTTPLFLEHFGLSSLQQLNELDPTLQRSNPRLKAASYKKQAKAGKPETPELPLGPEPAEGPEAQNDADGTETRDSPDDDERLEAPEDSGDSGDIFIDDTPDEFDDDDDDDDEYDSDEDAAGGENGETEE